MNIYCFEIQTIGISVGLYTILVLLFRVENLFYINL